MIYFPKTSIPDNLRSGLIFQIPGFCSISGLGIGIEIKNSGLTLKNLGFEIEFGKSGIIFEKFGIGIYFEKFSIGIWD